MSKTWPLQRLSPNRDNCECKVAQFMYLPVSSFSSNCTFVVPLNVLMWHRRVLKRSRCAFGDVSWNVILGDVMTLPYTDAPVSSFSFCAQIGTLVPSWQIWQTLMWIHRQMGLRRISSDYQSVHQSLEIITAVKSGRTVQRWQENVIFKRKPPRAHYHSSRC